MALEIEVNRKAGLVVVTGSPPLEAQDLMDHAKELLRIPDRPYRQLVDLRGHPDPLVDMESVRKVAEFLRAADSGDGPSRGKLALVADTHALYGTLRLFAAHREDESVEINVFRCLEDALRWLEVDPDSL